MPKKPTNNDENLYMEYVVDQEIEKASQLIVYINTYKKKRYQEVTELLTELKENKNKYRPNDYDLLKELYGKIIQLVA